MSRRKKSAAPSPDPRFDGVSLEERVGRLRDRTRGTHVPTSERQAIHAARELCDQLVIREAENAKLRDQIKALTAEVQAKSDRVLVLESTVVRPMKINAAFVEVARVILAETTWRRVWDRSVERASGQPIEREAL